MIQNSKNKNKNKTAKIEVNAITAFIFLQCVFTKSFTKSFTKKPIFCIVIFIFALIIVVQKMYFCVE
ncbi:hypothetical protein MOMA_04965 [Moraxella macacae 0408225]|uniref:Uncharacterized protein n=1 Tax=Moraxella macacae 0408225 TaxID=1230338 RepID=L2FA02_9GAMM|nr:hypothetical protein MOMA_04965 [Moraxella macacae 0408225]